MHLSHYHLVLSPFETVPDPRFLWLGETHKEAIAVLRRGILENKGLSVLTGGPGTGKSMLLNVLTAAFGGNVRCARVSDPAIGEMDFFRHVADAFKMGRSFKSKPDFLIHFQRFLDEAGSRFAKAVLVIDDAHRISDSLLDEVRVLAELDGRGGKGLSCVFAGQEEFLPILGRNRTLRQRVIFSHVIKPLTAAETGQYIAHRLRVAGARRPIFTESAGGRVFHWSKGNPRLINIICDQSLLTGDAAGLEAIGPEVVDESIGRTTIPIEPEPTPKTVPPNEAGSPGAEAAPRRPTSRLAVWGTAALGVLLGGLGVYWATGGARIDPAPPVQAPAGVPEAEVRRLQDQLTDLSRQKAYAEERVKGYEAKLAAVETELKGDAAARIAELEQTLKTLEKELYQERMIRGGLAAELSAREAAVQALSRTIAQLKADSPQVETSSRDPVPPVPQSKAAPRAPVVAPPVHPEPPAAAGDPGRPTASGPDPGDVIDFVLRQRHP